MRFYLPPHAWNQAQLDEAETHHAEHVLRLRPGDTITVFDGKGREASATIEAFHKKNTSLQLTVLQQTPPPTVELTLAQAIPKGRNMDFIIQKAVELGATRIIPIVTDRTIVRFHDAEASAKQQRWQAIALEACKQCGQNWIPTVERPCSLQESLKKNHLNDLLLIASLEKDSLPLKKILEQFTRLLSKLADASHRASWEEARCLSLESPKSERSGRLRGQVQGVSGVQTRSVQEHTAGREAAGSNAEGSPEGASLAGASEPNASTEATQQFAAAVEFRKKSTVSPHFSATIFIGPEGDFTPEEYLMARTSGYQAVSLGPIVLRTETASLYCLSVLAYELLRS